MGGLIATFFIPVKYKLSAYLNGMLPTIIESTTLTLPKPETAKKGFSRLPLSFFLFLLVLYPILLVSLYQV